MNCFNLSILLLCLTVAKALPTSNFAQPKFESTLANYLVKYNSLDYAVNPSVTGQCFNLYLPQLSDVANTFQTQYEACKTVANEKVANLTDQADGTKDTFIQDTKDIYTAYQSCANESDILTLFDCYSSVSSQEVSVVYAISNSATAAANTLSSGLQFIQNEQAVCANITEQTYVENTAATYELLDSCLKNGLPTSVSNTNSTTAAPIVSTTDSTSDNSTVIVSTEPIQTTAESSDITHDNVNVASSGTKSK